jgi:hypothetical protein
MDVTIRINCDNAAFEDDPYSEIARMLQTLAWRIESKSNLVLSGDSIPIKDSSGNKVGTCEVKE